MNGPGAAVDFAAIAPDKVPAALPLSNSPCRRQAGTFGGAAAAWPINWPAARRDTLTACVT